MSEHTSDDVSKIAEISQNDFQARAPLTWVVRPDPDLEDLIPSFISNRKNELEALEKAIGQRDFEFIRRTGHTWKGISRPYGFVHLETLSRHLETAGEEQNSEDLSKVLSEIRAYLENVRVVFDT